MPRHSLIITGTWILGVLSFLGCSDNATRDFDILIRNGTIVDGSGDPGFPGDVGIVGDTVVEIGDLTGKTAAKTIDAEGLVVSPGFIRTRCPSLGTSWRRSITTMPRSIATANCAASERASWRMKSWPASPARLRARSWRPRSPGSTASTRTLRRLSSKRMRIFYRPV